MSEEQHSRIEIPELEQIEKAKVFYSRQQNSRSRLRNTIIVLVVVAAVAVLVSTLWIPVLRIYGSSMTPTLEDGQIVVTVKGSEYGKGDLVAFYYGNKLLIKRVIAGPGDWVDIDDDGNVYVNGEYLNEPYVLNKSLEDCDSELPVQVGEGRWFLMGDNREVSVDSRMKIIGCVSEEQIIGKIVLRVWPFENFGLFE